MVAPNGDTVGLVAPNGDTVGFDWLVASKREEVGCDCPVVPNGKAFCWVWPAALNGDGAGCDCPVFPKGDTVGAVVVWTGVVVDVGPVAGVGEPKNENLGVLSAGLGGSKPEVVVLVGVLVVAAPGGLNVKADFVVL